MSGFRQVLMVVAADLGRTPEGGIIVGKDTQIACDRAADIANTDPKAWIVITAGEVPRGQYKHIWMGDVMRDYLLLKRNIAPERIIIAKAPEFHTYSEMFMLARLIAKGSDQLYNSRNVLQVRIVCKWWHAPRARVLFNYHLKKRHLQRLVRVRIEWCRSEASWLTILIREPIAWIVNINRMLVR